MVLNTQTIPGTDISFDMVASPVGEFLLGSPNDEASRNEGPQVRMTQFAWRQYTKWLSGITSQEFRLPTEAEWE